MLAETSLKGESTVEVLLTVKEKKELLKVQQQDVGINCYVVEEYFAGNELAEIINSYLDTVSAKMVDKLSKWNIEKYCGKAEFFLHRHGFSRCVEFLFIAMKKVRDDTFLAILVHNTERIYREIRMRRTVFVGIAVDIGSAILGSLGLRTVVRIAKPMIMDTTPPQNDSAMPQHSDESNIHELNTHGGQKCVIINNCREKPVIKALIVKRLMINGNIKSVQGRYILTFTK
jgi:hypothetical protein